MSKINTHFNRNHKCQIYTYSECSLVEILLQHYCYPTEIWFESRDCPKSCRCTKQCRTLLCRKSVAIPRSCRDINSRMKFPSSTTYNSSASYNKLILARHSKKNNIKIKEKLFYQIFLHYNLKFIILISKN